jgi:hypothetical protein
MNHCIDKTLVEVGPKRLELPYELNHFMLC